MKMNWNKLRHRGKATEPDLSPMLGCERSVSFGHQARLAV